MSIANECLICLSSQNWSKLNSILSIESNWLELNDDPTFRIFESNLVSEIKKIDKDDTFELPQLVLIRIYQLNKSFKSLNLSKNCFQEIIEYLFNKTPSEEYAKLLPENPKAVEFLKNKQTEIQEIITRTKIASNLNIKIGSTGGLLFSKKITNSKQEDELFEVATEILANKLIYPNIALSLIIDSKILDQLTEEQKHIFFTSSLDLCVVNRETLMPEHFFELDSSWHDKPSQQKKDIIKNELFNMAGLKLVRIRKIDNKSIKTIFKLALREYTR